MQQLDLQFYTNNITRCIGIVNLLSARIQDHQCYTLIKFVTLFTSQLSTNYNFIKREYVFLSISYQFTIPTKKLFPIMSPSTNTQYSSTENINIFTEYTTTPTSPQPFVSKYYFYNTLQEMLLYLI